MLSLIMFLFIFTNILIVFLLNNCKRSQGIQIQPCVNQERSGSCPLKYL